MHHHGPLTCGCSLLPRCNENFFVAVHRLCDRFCKFRRPISSAVLMCSTLGASARETNSPIIPTPPPIFSLSTELAARTNYVSLTAVYDGVGQYSSKCYRLIVRGLQYRSHALPLLWHPHLEAYLHYVCFVFLFNLVHVCLAYAALSVRTSSFGAVFLKQGSS